MEVDNIIKNIINNAIAEGKVKLIELCSCGKEGKYLSITDCIMCEDCEKELSESFEEAMKMDRSDYPEL